MPAESLPRSGRSHRRVTVNSLKDSLQSQHTWPKLTITIPLTTTKIIYKNKKKSKRKGIRELGKCKTSYLKDHSLGF